MWHLYLWASIVFFFFPQFWPRCMEALGRAFVWRSFCFCVWVATSFPFLTIRFWVDWSKTDLQSRGAERWQQFLNTMPGPWISSGERCLMVRRAHEMSEPEALTINDSTRDHKHGKISQRWDCIHKSNSYQQWHSSSLSSTCPKAAPTSDEVTAWYSLAVLVEPLGVWVSQSIVQTQSQPPAFVLRCLRACTAFAWPAACGGIGHGAASRRHGWTWEELCQSLLARWTS